MRGIPGVNEKDWKLFRSRIPDWQEAYMDRLNHEYIELLSGEGNPSDKFWALEERIRSAAKGILQINSGHWRNGSARIRKTVVFRLK